MKKILVIIPARSGSKGVKNKNIKLLGDKPLIGWSILAAQKSKYMPRVLVTTDAEEIKKVSLDMGAEVPFLRPKELASDEVHSVYPILHALNWLSENDNYHPDIVIMLLPTSPLRTAKDIDNAIDLYLKNPDHNVISVTELDKQLPHLRYVENGLLVPVQKQGNYNVQRQDLQKLYYLNGSIYVSDFSRLLEDKTFHIEKTIAYIMDKDRSVDINTEEDFKQAEYLLKLKYGK